MQPYVYILCALTSLVCTILLFRFYLKNRIPLLLLSTICFAGQIVSNCALLLDLLVYPEIDLTPWRLFPAFIGVVALMVGLIWDTV